MQKTTAHPEVAEAWDGILTACEALGFRMPRTDDDASKLAGDMRVVLTRIDTYFGRRIIFGESATTREP